MLPEVRLDTDTFQGLIDEYMMQIASIYPEWTNYNYSDPGMTFIELFAWMKENQQFFMEQLSPDHYARFFRMMGLKQKNRVPARILAQVIPKNTVSETGIEKGTVYYAENIPFSVEKDECIPAFSISALETREGGKPLSFIDAGQLDSEHPIHCYPFGTNPLKGTEFFIYLDGPLTAGKEYHLSVRLEVDQGRNPLTEKAFTELVSLKFEYYGEKGFQECRLTSDETHGLLFTGRVGLSVPDGMEMYYTGENGFGGYCLRVTLEEGCYDMVPVIRGISFDEVVLTQEIALDCGTDGILLGEGNGTPGQTLQFPWAGILQDSIRITVPDVLDPEKRVTWERFFDFSEAEPSTAGYVVSEYFDSIRFGNGYRGLPPEGEIRLHSLSTSLGSGGNVRLGSELKRVGEDGPGAVLVTHSVLRAGQSPEELEEILQRARLERPLNTASTAGDYETLIMATPGLKIASCKVIEELSSLTEVAIVVRPGTNRETLSLSGPMRKNILDNLEDKRLIGTKITLYSPEYIRIDVSLDYVPEDDFPDSEIKVEAAVRDYFGDYGSFGDPFVYGRFYGMIDSLACVKKINSLSFFADSILVTRNTNGDLVPPENGLFLPGKIELNR